MKEVISENILGESTKAEEIAIEQALQWEDVWCLQSTKKDWCERNKVSKEERKSSYGMREVMGEEKDCVGLCKPL